MEKKGTISEEVKMQLPCDETIYELAEVFKIFGDSTRTKILSCLAVRDLCVGELSEVMNMSVSAISHQLRILRSAKLVKGIKDGKEVKYKLDDKHVEMIIQCGLSHLNEED